MDTQRILVVEDSVVQFAILSAGLKNQNWECVHAPSFADAIATIRSNGSLCCIVSDVSLPGMSFEDFLRELEGLQVSIPVIIYTANTSIHEKTFSSFPFVKNTLHKPTGPAKIAELVRYAAGLGKESQ